MAAPTQAQLAQLNVAARQLIKARALAMRQQIFNSTFAANGTSNLSVTQPVITVNPRNVGLIRGFWVKIVATVTNGSAVQIDLSDLGPANLLSQIQFNDLQNNTRIQTTGWHIALLNSLRFRRPYGTSMIRGTGIDAPINFGSNFIAQNSAPNTIAAGAAGTITFWYYVPLSYTDDDLRGAVYANVVNATMQLLLTVNPTPVVNNGTDSTGAIYVGDAAGATALARISSMTVTVYQSYLDQLPAGSAGVILPVLDLATIYEMKNTIVNGMVANQDFPIQFSNFRDFLSVIAGYVNTGATGARTGGQDTNTWALQTANFTNVWKDEPGLIALRTRNHLGTDMPPGFYYFGSREKPISTVQYGNQQLVLNPITAGNGAYLAMAYEDFAIQNTLAMAGSLAAS
jgi:P3 major capsid protein